MEPEFSAKRLSMHKNDSVSPKHAAVLHHGENVLFVGHTLNFNDGSNVFFLTGARLITFSSGKLIHAIDYKDIASFEPHAKGGLLITRKDADTINLLRLPAQEYCAAQAALEMFTPDAPNEEILQRWRARRTILEESRANQKTENIRPKKTSRENHEQDSPATKGFFSEFKAGYSKERAAQAMEREIRDRRRREAAAEAQWPEAKIPCDQPNRATVDVISRNCAPSETPWLIVSISGNGSLVAFEDRLLIIKTGLVQGINSGAMGGERSATIYYTDITGIEFNSGMALGVLEILTPSYQGTANKDYWRGITAGGNANSGNPRAISNTLPMGKFHHRQIARELQELRSRISAAKRASTRVTVDHQPAPHSLASELAALADLRESGALTDEDFLAAKAQLLSGPRT